MRYFVVRQFTIDSQLPRLLCDDHEVTIEPKLHQLLVLFCLQPNTIVSRDEIIAKVNQGVIVSDNAVNKMVANLRQLLGDNPRQPNFIKTIPKQGYCFIGVVRALNSLPDKSPLKQITKTNKLIGAAIAGLLILVTTWLIYFNNNIESLASPSNQRLVPLTRHSGVEFSPSMSADGRYLAYTRNDPSDNVRQLWLRHLDPQQNKGQEVQLATLPTGAEVAWSPDSTKLVYTDYSNGVCQFRLIRFDRTRQTSTSTIANCNARFVSQLFFDGSESQLYYVARVQGLSPMQVFSLNIDNKTRQLINQPPLEGNGNYAIDLSPDGSKLLILSAADDYKTAFYQLDRQSNQLSLKAQWQRLVKNAIWHHDNQTIVHTSNQYSHELIRSDISGNKIATLVSTSNRVAENYRRHPNGRDFYFTSFMMNNDNLRLDTRSNQQFRRFNSAVYDKLPTFVDHPTRWMFVSKRNGVSQIFSGDENQQHLAQLSDYQQEPTISLLDVSPNAERLLIAGFKQFTLMNLAQKSQQTIETTQGLMLAANWWSDQQVAISTLANGQATLQLYDLNSQTFIATQPRWQGAFASPSGKRRFYIEARSAAVYEWLPEQQNYRETGVILPDIYGGSGYSVRASETHLLYSQQSGNTSELISVDLATKERQTLGSWLYLAGFDLFEDSIVLSYERSRNGDVMMTSTP